MPSSSQTDWFVTPANLESAPLRLFCFPYAGGGTWIFRQWPRLLGDKVAVCPVKLAGRADRFREPAATDLHGLADRLADELGPMLEQPYAFFGYSMGALLAFETATRLAAAGRRTPDTLIVAAAPAPPLVHVADPVHGLADTELVKAVQARYRNPAMAAVSEEMLPLIMPALRGDMTMYETYRSRAATAPLACAIRILGGVDDTITVDELTAWEAHSTAAATKQVFAGGHFFIHEQEEAVVESVAQQLRS